jgi:hypothetical protein
MKKLLLLWIFSGSLDGFSQVPDTVYMRRFDPERWGIKSATTLDTLPSRILISHEPPAFTHSIDGYCVYKDNVCTGKHLRFWRKRWITIGPEYTVWGCKRRVAP